MRTRTGPAWTTARRTSRFCGTWHSTSCRRMARRKRCAASFSGPDGTMPISPASLLYSEVQLPCGAMSITSTPGAGTTVTLWLPQGTGGVVQATGEADTGRDALDASAHVLLVDDDDMVREMLAAQLDDLGFHILPAAGGTEAIALLEAGETVDALGSDLSMPGMNGVATIEKARSLRPGLPCFLLTGYVGELRHWRPGTPLPWSASQCRRQPWPRASRLGLRRGDRSAPERPRALRRLIE